MSSPEKPFGMTTQAGAEAVSSPVSTPDKPRVKERKQKVERKGLTAGKVVLAGLATLGTVEAAGIAYQELTNNQPLSPQSIVEDVMWPYTTIKDLLKPPIPPSFDPELKASSIGIGANAIVSSREELKAAYSQQVEENKETGRPTVVFPIAFTASGQRVDYRYQAPLTPFVDKSIVVEAPGAINTKPSRGNVITVPAENAEVFQFRPSVIDGKEYFKGFYVPFEQNGELWRMVVGQSDVRTLELLIDTSIIPIVPEDQYGVALFDKAKNGLRLPLGTRLSVVSLDGSNVYLRFNRYNPETKRWESVKPNFVIDKSGEQTKLLIALSNQQ